MRIRTGSPGERCVWPTRRRLLARKPIGDLTGATPTGMRQRGYPGLSTRLPPSCASRRPPPDPPRLPGVRRPEPPSRRRPAAHLRGRRRVCDGSRRDLIGVGIRMPLCESLGAGTHIGLSRANSTGSTSSAAISSPAACTPRLREAVSKRIRSLQPHRGIVWPGAKSIDTRGDGRLQGGGHADVTNLAGAPIIAGLPGQHSLLGEVAHDLLGEEGVAAGSRGDRTRYVRQRGVGTHQFGRQRRRGRAG